MDTVTAFANGAAARAAGNPVKVFDWDKAAEMIREKRPTVARAGLESDWEWTGGTIWERGKPCHDDYTYLASNWARPEIELDGESYYCFRLRSESPGWDAHTKWPESALAILSEDVA